MSINTTPGENPIIFANNPLDRAGHLRKNPEWLEQQLKSDTALFVPLWQLRPLVLPPLQSDDGRGDGRDVGWLPFDAIRPLMTDTTLMVFLGLNRRGKPLFAVDASALSAPEDQGPFKGMGQFEELRALAAAGDMAATELAILAQAKAMLDWHARHLFCSQCGAATEMAEAGYKRVCLSCETEHFPRTDPVVIMLATRGDKCLVGRQAGWPQGSYSALAGFVEPGETLEEAVAREILEEAGIQISSVHYVATQPWPFPASLMFGCLAKAESEDIKLGDDELEEARWIARADIRDALDAQDKGTSARIGLPPKLAIAHQLLRVFAEQGD